jgi:hypothetical protein
MYPTTHQVVIAGEPEPEDRADEQLEDAEPITDEASGLEMPELSIEELEEIFSDLN